MINNMHETQDLSNLAYASLALLCVAGNQLVQKLALSDQTAFSSVCQFVVQAMRHLQEK